MPAINVNGTRLHYEERGAGFAILCIHGMGSSALMWGNAIDELAELGRVITYDRRGCTRSKRPEPYTQTSVAEQTDDAAALIDELAAAPAIVIGRSYGGAVAIDLALRHPSRVQALVLLEGDALGLSPSSLEWTKAIRSHLHEVADKRGVDAVYESLVSEVLGEDAWDSFPDEARQVLTQNGAAVLAELNYVDEPMPDAAALAAIGRPTLVVAATESPPEQRKMAEATADALPDARLVQIGGDHLIDPAGPEVIAFVKEVLS